MSNEERKLDVKYTGSEDDYMRFNLYHFKEKKNNKPKIVLAFCLLIVFLIILNYMIYITSENLKFPIFVGVVSILFLILFIKDAPQSVKAAENARILKRIKKHQDDDGYIGDIHVSLSNRGLTKTLDGKILDIDYKEIKDVVYDEGLIYIYISEKKALVIPKEAFRNKKLEHEFVQKIKSEAQLN